MVKNYRKHSIITHNGELSVKNWMRQNLSYFKQINGVPTSEQIGSVLNELGYKRKEDSTSVTYSILRTEVRQS